jgi:RNA polymerase sigma-70 factor (ECF subfamily)
VRDAIERLRPVDREVLELVMWEGLTHAEAAQVLGCSTNAVAVRLHKARKRLQAELGRGEASAPDRGIELTTGAV